MAAASVLHRLTQGGDMASQPQKCAHEACNCTVDGKGPYGKYCSEHCQKNAKMTVLRCDCQHPGCR